VKARRKAAASPKAPRAGSGNPVVDLHRAIIRGEVPGAYRPVSAYGAPPTREEQFLYRASDIMPRRVEAARVAPLVALPAAWRRRLRRAHRMPAEWEAMRRRVLDLRGAVDAEFARVAALDAALEAMEEQLEAAASEWYEDRGDTQRVDISGHTEHHLRRLLRDDDAEPTQDDSVDMPERGPEDQRPMERTWRGDREAWVPATDD
jgi:hypothetical protein